MKNMHIKNICLFVLLCCCLCSCKTRQDTVSAAPLLSLQTIDRNGFSETISSKDRVQRFTQTDFLASQPYQKVLRVFGRDAQGKSTSKITSYHSNGYIWQYLEIVEGRANGAYKEWHPNGILKIEANVIEGLGDVSEAAQMSWLFEGKSSVWDEHGTLEAVFHYTKGMLEGNAYHYHPSGQVAKSIPYVQDNIEGDVLVFDEQGRPLEKISFAQGIKHGVAEGKSLNVLSDQGDQGAVGNKVAGWSYHEEYDQGVLKQGSYTCRLFPSLPGVIDGEGYQAIFKEGCLASLIEIHRGQVEGSIRSFHPDGSLKSLYHLQNEKKLGAEWEYYPCSPLPDSLALPSRPKILVFWHDDILQGLTKTWYDNGVLESEREMNQNAMHGLCSAYYKDGSLMLVEEYQRGNLLKGSYFKKGDKQPISRIEDGHGIATLHHGEGYFLRKTSYEKGMPILHE